MGIPRFYRDWLERHVKEAILTGEQTKFLRVASLSIDMNSLLHKIFQRVYGYGDYLNVRIADALHEVPNERLEGRLDEALEREIAGLYYAFRPQTMMVLAVDGVAPAAKFNQQKGRRYHTDPIVRENGEVIYNTNGLTPGTTVMERIHQKLQLILESLSAEFRPAQGAQPIKIIYSSYLDPGEGEHKIMQIYRDPELIFSPDEHHLLIGEDADLILLSLIFKRGGRHLPIYIAREKFVREKNKPIFIRDYDVVDIQRVREYLMTETGRGETSLYDFTVMMSLLGNDFIPKVPSLARIGSGLRTLFDIYQKNKGLTLTYLDGEQNVIIDWSGMTKFLNLILADEGEKKLLDELATTAFLPQIWGAATKTLTPEGGIFMRIRHQTAVDLWYQHTLGYTLDGQQYPPTQEQIDEMAIWFLYMMEWTLAYYTRGLHAINKLVSYPYSYAPMLSTLVGITPSMSFDKWPTIAPVTDARPYVPPLLQMLLIFPPSSAHLIPEQEARDLMQPATGINPNNGLVEGTESPIWDLYPESFATDSLQRLEVGRVPATFYILPPLEISRTDAAMREFVPDYTFQPSSAEVISSLHSDEQRRRERTRRAPAVVMGRGRERGHEGMPQRRFGEGSGPLGRTRAPFTREERPSPTQEGGQALPVQGRGSGPIGQGRGQVLPVQGRGQATFTQGRGQTTFTRGRGQVSPSPARGRGRASPVRGRERGRTTFTRGRGRGRGFGQSQTPPQMWQEKPKATTNENTPPGV